MTTSRLPVRIPEGTMIRPLNGRVPAHLNIYGATPRRPVESPLSWAVLLAQPEHTSVGVMTRKLCAAIERLVLPVRPVNLTTQANENEVLLCWGGAKGLRWR